MAMGDSEHLNRSPEFEVDNREGKTLEDEPAGRVLSHRPLLRRAGYEADGSVQFSSEVFQLQFGFVVDTK